MDGAIPGTLLGANGCILGGDVGAIDVAKLGNSFHCLYENILFSLDNIAAYVVLFFIGSLAGVVSWLMVLSVVPVLYDKYFVYSNIV